MSEIPKHIAQTKVCGAPVGFVWNHASCWEPKSGRPSDTVSALVDEMALCAQLAVAAAVSEWIAWRLEGLADTSIAFELVEAAWAAAIDPRYCAERQWIIHREEGEPGLPDSQRGWILPEDHNPYASPTTGPIYVMGGILEDAHASQAMPEQTDQEVGYLILLARHVIKPKAPFNRWLKQTSQRLTQWYPRDSQEPLGPSVPRQAVDPSCDFDPDRTPQLVSEFAKQLNPDTNRFLASHEVLEEHGLLHER